VTQVSNRKRRSTAVAHVREVPHYPPPAMGLRVSVESTVQRRLISLDVFRGAAIVAMILVNNPGDPTAAFDALRHSRWHGWTFADTIFPAFLWIAGFALTLSLQSRVTRGESRTRILTAAARRAAVLFLCGLLIEGFPYFDLSHYQYTGVLQKIAIAWFLACAICLYTDWRGRMLALLLLFAGYVCFMLGVAVPECAGGPWSPACNAARYFDDHELAGHLWEASMGNDPDGIIGSIAAAASVLLGVLAGQWFRAWRWQWFAASCAALALAGLAIGAWIPINKILWTPSYTLFMGGLAGAAFLAVYWLVDVKGWRGWALPLRVFGANALAAYVVSRLGADVLKKHVHGTSIYHDLLRPWLSAAPASLMFALLNVLAVYLFVWLLYRRDVFLRL
jgi:predicted acyltransferase